MRIGRRLEVALVATLVFGGAGLIFKLLPTKKIHAQTPTRAKATSTPNAKSAEPAGIRSEAPSAADCCNGNTRCKTNCSCSCSQNKSEVAVTVSSRTKRNDVRSELEDPAIVLSMLPDGSRVQKGQLVGELDSSRILEAMIAQTIKRDSAQSSAKKAVIDRELAEIKLKEFDSLNLIDLQTLRAEVLIAKGNRDRAKRDLERGKQMDKRLSTNTTSRFQDEFERLQTVLELTQTKLEIFEKYTSLKGRKQIEAELEQAKSEELAKKAGLELESDRCKKLEKQLAKVKLYAPTSGVVALPDSVNPNEAIVEGAAIRQGQLIFSIR